MDQSPWLLLGAFFFLPTIIALLFRRDQFLLVLALNVAVFWTNTARQSEALYVVMIIALFWPERFLFSAFFRRDTRRWVERQCPACQAWIPRTAGACEHCNAAVEPVDQSCPNCDQAMPLAASVCLACGHDQKAQAH